MSQYLLALESPLERHEERSPQALAASDDTALLNRYFAGENAALVELYDRHNHRLYLYCLKLLGSTEQAEDLTQELWEKVARLRSRPQHVLNPGGFLLTIARNLCFNQLKARKRFSPLDSLNEAVHPSYEMRELTELEDIVVAALERLQEDYREVLILNLYSGYRLDEIATMLGKSPDAIRKRASRARLQLRTMVMEMIEQRGGDLSALDSLNRQEEEEAR
jgi:RNA polymerase sigma-70 factor (ECF subfamily)